MHALLTLPDRVLASIGPGSVLAFRLLSLSLSILAVLGTVGVSISHILGRIRDRRWLSLCQCHNIDMTMTL